MIVTEIMANFVSDIKCVMQKQASWVVLVKRYRS